MGATVCVFGDIDIPENRLWQEARCLAAGLEACFPLWQTPRDTIVKQVLEAGFKCLVKTVNAKLLPEDLLGKYLCPDVLKTMEKSGVDLCGENGEYHTLVVDGPVFVEPLRPVTGDILRFGDYSTIEITRMA